MPTINVKRVLTCGSFLPEMGVFPIKATNYSVRNKNYRLFRPVFILLLLSIMHSP